MTNISKEVERARMYGYLWWLLKWTIIACYREYKTKPVMATNGGKRTVMCNHTKTDIGEI